MPWFVLGKELGLELSQYPITTTGLRGTNWIHLSAV